MASEKSEERSPWEEVADFTRGVSQPGTRRHHLRRLGRGLMQLLCWGTGLSLLFACGEIAALGAHRAWLTYGPWWFKIPALFVGIPSGLLLVMAAAEKLFDLLAASAMLLLQAVTGVFGPRARAATPKVGQFIVLGVVGAFIVGWGYKIAEDDAKPKAATQAEATAKTQAQATSTEPAGASSLEKALILVGVWFGGVFTKVASDALKDAWTARLAKSRQPEVVLLAHDGRPIHRSRGL